MKYVNTLASTATTILPATNRIHLAMSWLLAFTLFLLLGQQANAQLGWGPDKFEYQGNNTQLISFCEVDPAFGFHMQWSGVGAGNPGTNPKLTVELPAGVSYRAGSISDVVAHPGGAATAAVVGNTLEIYLPDLTGSESGEVAFELVYTCDVDFSNPLLLNIAVVSDEGTFTDVTTPINNTYATPQLVLNGSTNSTITDVEVGDNFVRTTELLQSGQYARLYSLDLTFDYGVDLSVASQTISDGVTTVNLTGLTATGGTITLSSTDPAYAGLAWPFFQGDVWTISEDVTVNACTDILHTASANYQCGTNPCQTPGQITHSTQLESSAPAITEISSTRAFTADACITDPVTSEYTWEITGKAYNTNFQIRSRDTRSYIDPSSVEIDYGTGTYVPYTGGFNSVTTQSPCGSPEIRYATLDPYAPLIDGSVTAQTIRIRYDLLTCCPTGGCSENTGSIFGSYTYFYVEDQCGVQIYDRADVYSLVTEVSAADQIPAFMTDATPENFQYDVNYLGISSLLMSRGTVCMEFSIPVELNVLGAHTTTAPNSDVLAAGTAYWYDVSLTTGSRREATIVSLGGGDYEACFPAGDYQGTGSKIFIPVEYICSPMNCGGSAATTMVMGLKLGTQPACGPASECMITMMCEEATVSLDNTCCGISCDGMTHLGFDVIRDCYGEPDNDNDGCADASGVLDMTRVATKRALKGDEMTFEALARVNLQNPLDSFNYVYFELAFPDPHGIGASTTITITDVSEGLTYTCSSVNVFPNGTDSYIYYLTTDLLRGCGDIPADFKWEDNDLITLDGSFTVLATQDECGVEQVNIDAEFYASRAPLPPPGPDRLQCNTPVPSEYSRVGYTWELYEHRREAFGCAGGRYMFRVDFCIGGGPINVQPFPYEVRQFGQPKRMGMQVPTGLRFDSLELYHYRFTKRIGNNNYIYNEDVTAFAVEADGEVWFDFDSWFDKDPAACELDDRPNGGYRVYLDAFFEGTCNSEPSRPTTFFEAEMDFCSSVVDDELFRKDSIANANIPVIVADLEVQTSQSLILPFNEQAEWTFNIRETNAGTARNSWFMLASPSGAIMPTSASNDGTPLTPTNGIYQLGTINSGVNENFSFRADYIGCGQDSIVVYVGWDCDNYPASASQVLAGGLPCAVDTLVLYMEPEVPGIQQVVTREPAGVVAPCTSFEYEIEILNSTNAELYEPTFELYIPYAAGISIDAANAKACWPCEVGPTPADFNYNIFDPTETIITPLGIRYIWDLESLISAFDVSMADGWPGTTTSNPDSTRISVTFPAETNCNFVAGDWLNFVAKGRSWCGEEEVSFLRNGVQLEYPGISPPYGATVTSDPVVPFSVCGEATQDLTGTITFFSTTDGFDTLVVALPPSLEYSSLIFNPSQLAGPPNVRTIFAPGGGSSIQEVRVGVQPGISGGTSIPWGIETVVNSAKHTCDDPTALNIRTIRSAMVSCKGVMCEASAATASVFPPPVIEAATDSVEIGEFNVSVNCGMTSLTIDGIEIINSGGFDVAQDVTVDFYHDVDNSFGYSTGDVLLGSALVSGGIPVGGQVVAQAGPFTITPAQSCKIIAVASGCSCKPAEAYITSVKTDNAGLPQAGCAADALTVGCGEDLTSFGYTYAWYGLNGAPTVGITSPNSPNTTISYANFSSSPAVLEYVLVTEHPGGVCSSVDTIALTFDGVEPEVGPELKVCQDSTGYLTGPNGYFNYQWSPTTGLSNPLDPNTAVLSPPGAIDYTLTYSTLSGCSAIYTQKVRSAVCTDLELTKTLISSPTGVGSVATYGLTAINRGPNGASGVVISDTLSQNLAFLSSVPSGDYDPVTHAWTIDEVMLPNDTFELIIYAQVVGEGVTYNVAEVSSMDQADLDSTPGNDNADEDDQSGVCIQATVTLECRQVFTARIPDEFATYQWFKDAVLIPGATADSLDITETGTYSVTVDGGQNPYGLACPFVVTKEACATIGDFVWEDLDADGQQDGSETGIAGVTVYLFDAITGLPFDSAVTDALGGYAFSEVPSGNFYVQVNTGTLPQNLGGTGSYAPTTANSGNDVTDSDINGSGRSSTFSFDASLGDNTTIDAGFVPSANLGDYVWVDANQNGIQDLGETPVVGAIARLVDATTGATIQTSVTDANGEYMFTMVPFGDYRVEFDYSSATTGGGSPMGVSDYVFTQTGAGTMNNNSDAIAASGSTATINFDPRTGDDLSYDAGIFAVADIGDRVFADANGDGVRQAGESGVEGVTVTLYDDMGNVVATTTTDVNGNYLFPDQPSGTYSIGFDYTTIPGTQDYIFSPQGTVGSNDNSQSNPLTGNTAPFSFDASTGDDLASGDQGIEPVADIGDRVFVDSDRDGIQDASESGLAGVTVELIEAGVVIATTTTDAAGNYLFENVPAGTYSINYNTATSSTGLEYFFSDQNAGGDDDIDSDAASNAGNVFGGDDAASPQATSGFVFDPTSGDDSSFDAGVFPVANIGNFVWIDQDADGLQDTGEPGVNGATVRLYDAVTNAVIASTTTDASGFYSFNDVPEGDYYIGFDASTAVGGNALIGTAQNAGTGTNDSDADVNGFTTAFNFDPASGDELTYDAGYLAQAGIGNYVWVDTNGDGIQDPGEESIPGIAVRLYAADGTLVAETTTAADGTYFFPGIASGDYYLAFDASSSEYGSNFAFMAADAGGDDSLDSDASQPFATGSLAARTATFTFDATAGDATTFDAAIQPIPSVSSVKRVVRTTNLPNGNIDVTYSIGMANDGPTGLTNLSLLDDLQGQLGAGFVSVDAPTITSSSAEVDPALNVAYDGTSANDDIFSGSALDRLRPGQEIFIQLVVEIDPAVATFPLENQATAGGDGLDPADNPLTSGGVPVEATDDTDSGGNFSSSNSGEPGDTGGSSDPTPVVCENADIIITGNVPSPCGGGDVMLTTSSAVATARYEWRVQGNPTVISTLQNPTISNVTATTVYELTLVNDTDNCYFDLVETVTVAIAPNPTAAPTAGLVMSGCDVDRLELNSNAAGGTSPYSYVWTGPDGFASTAANPQITAPSSSANGTYTVTVTDASGCTDTEFVSVSGIAPGQTDPIITSTGPACEGDQIVLSVPAYSGSVVTYTWSFDADGAGPGIPTTSLNNTSGQGTNEIFLDPVNAADHDGLWNVSINVDGCALSSDYTVEVFANATASATYAGTAAVCNGDAFGITGSGTGTAPLTFSWSGPSGFSASTQSISIADADASNNGLYTLTVTTASGCTATSSVTVTSVQPERAPISLTTNSPVCNGTSLTLTATAGGNDYSWYKDGALVTTTAGVNTLTVTSADPSYGSGTWSVTNEDANTCLTTSNLAVVEVNEIPNAAATANGAPSGTVVCAGQDIQLAGTTSPVIAGATYRWYSDVGLTTLVTLAQNPMLSGLAPNSYTYYLQVEVDGCTSAVSSTGFTISTPVSASAGSSYTLSATCSPSDLSLTSTPGGGSAPYTFAWSGPNGYSASVQNPTIPSADPSNNGTYTVLITDANDCTATASTTVNSISNQPQEPQLTVSNATPCAGDAVVISSTSYEGASVSYTWEFDSNGFGTVGGTTTLSNATGQGTSVLTIDPSVAIAAAAEYRVVTVVDGCILTSDPITYVVQDAPTLAPLATYTPTGDCSSDNLSLAAGGAAVAGSTYAWTGPNGFTASISNPTIVAATPAANGTYQVSVSTPAGCTTNADVSVSGIRPALVEPTIASSGPACVGDVVTLSIPVYTGSNITYTWNIPAAAIAAGNISGLAGNVLTIDPLVAAHAGNYSVTVDVDGCTTTSDVYTVQVFAAPTLAPSATAGTICTTDDLQLNAGGTGATAWQWNGPAGFTSTAQNPLISGVSPSYNGTYTVTATNLTGCITTSTVDVNNIDDVPMQPSVSDNGPVCVNDNIVLSSSTSYSGTVTYQWTNANGTSLTPAMGGNTAIATIAASDALAISPFRLQVTLDGCAAPISEVLDVQVDQIPVATASNSGPVCVEEPVSLLAGTVPGATYEWRTGGVLVSTDQGYNVSGLSTTTTYELTVVRGQCASLPVTTTVTVSPTPDLSPRFDYTAASDCSLSNLDLFAHTGGLSAHAVGYTYAWTGPNGFTSTEQNPVIPNATPAANGSYVLTVTEGASSACAKTAVVQVSSVREPIAEPTIVANGEGCENATVTLSVPTYSGSSVTYTWATPASTTQDISGQGTNVLTINPSDAAVHSGSYAVTIVVDGCSVTSDPYVLDIDATPEVMPTADYTLSASCAVSDLTLESNPVGTPALIAGYTYSWTGPNGFTSTEQNPVIANATPAANGSYIVTVTNLDGCVSATSVQVNGIQSTVAEPVIATTGPACEGEPITLSIAAYSGSSVSYTWNTPGATTTDISGFNTNAITIAPATGAIHNGDYSVTVVVDGCTLTSDIFEVELFDLPTASPSITFGDICFGESIQLSANDVYGVSFAWTGPNGFSSTAENPTIANATPAANGTYTLEVTSIEGCVNQASVTVNTVREMPTQPVLTSNGTVCEDSDIVLTTSTPATGVTTYQWRNGAGTALAAGFGGTTNTLTIPATNAAAIQPFTLEVIVDGCPSMPSAPMTVQVDAVPTAVATNNGPICAGESATLRTTGVHDTYTWRVAGNAAILSTDQEFTVTPATTTTYEVVVSNGTCSSAVASTTVRVNEVPTAAPSFTYALAANCSASDLQLFANAAGGTPTLPATTVAYSYAWTGPNGFTSTQANPIIAAATAGDNGVYTVHVTDENGCAAATETVAVNGISNTPAEPQISDSGAACEGESITLSIAAYSGASVSYVWSRNASSTIADVSGQGTNQLVLSPVSQAAHAGTYTVQVIVDGCVLDSDPYDIQIYAEPTAAPTVTVSDACEGGSFQLFANGTVAQTGGLTYAWTGPNGFASTLENPTISPASIQNNGTYLVTVTSNTGCAATTTIDVTSMLPEAHAPTIDAPSICEGEDLVLSTSASGTNFEWIGPNGASASTLAMSGMTTAIGSTTLNPSNANYLPGEWSVRVTDANGCVATSAAVAVTISPVPLASPSNNGPICESSVATFSVQDVQGATFAWYDNDPSLPGTNLVSQERTYAEGGLSVGTHTRYVIITVNNCASPAASTTVTITGAPTASPSYTYSVSTSCAPEDLRLFANVNPPAGTYTYSWTGPNGFTSTLENPTIPNVDETFNGSYVVTITDGGACSVVSSVEVGDLVNSQPEPVISFSGPTCEGGTMTLTIPTYVGLSVDYAWTVPGTVVSGVNGFGTNELIISPASAAQHRGLYRVTVTVDGCVLVGDNVAVDLYESPTVAPLATIVDNCDGGRIEFQSRATTRAGALTYAWSGPNGFTSTQVNPIIDPATEADNGRYEVTVTNANGCTATQAVDVSGMLPVPESPTLSAPSICEGEDLILTSSTSGTQFEWIGPNGASISTLAMPGMTTGSGSTTLPAGSANYLSGDWSVRVTDANGCVATSPAIAVLISDVPVATLSNSSPVCDGESVQFSMNSIPDAVYAWYNGDPNVGGVLVSQDRVMTRTNLAVGTHTYYAVLTVGGCSSTAVASTAIVNELPIAIPTHNYSLQPDCSPGDLTLQANPRNGAGGYTYAWTGPNGFTSTLANPVLVTVDATYNGSYQVVVTDAAGCSVTATTQVDVIVDPQAVPVISASGPACEGEEIRLSIPGYSGSSVNYSWTVPGSTAGITGFGTSELVISPASAALHEGLYRVTVTVDGCVLLSDNYRVDVFEQPTVAPLVTIIDNCDGGRIEFEARATTPPGLATFTWTGPNGFTSTQENPVIDPASVDNNGRYEVSITSASGCVARQVVDVTGMLPVPEMPSLSAANICQGEDLVLATSADGVQYEWIGPNGSSTSTLLMAGMTTPTGITTLDPTNANYLAGDWSVRVTDANGCVVTSNVLTIEINDIPLAIPTNDGPVCDGGDIVLNVGSALGQNDASNWYVDNAGTPGTLFSQEVSPVLTNLAPGTYTYWLEVVSNGCSSAPVSTTVQVNALPTASPLYSYSVATDCSAEDLTLTANPGAGLAPYSYNWSGPNGFTSTDQNPVIVSVDASDNGSYSVQITDANGCENTATVQVDDIVNAVAQPVVTFSGPTCEGGNVSLSTSTYTGSNVAYTWTMPSGTRVSGQGTPQLVINGVASGLHDGDYTVEVVVDGCTLTSAPYRLTTLSAPTSTPSFVITDACDGGSVELAANAAGVGPLSYAWSGPNGFTSTIENPVLAQADETYNGPYTLEVTSANGCVSTTTLNVSGLLPPAEIPTIAAPSICLGDDLVLTTSTSGVRFEWIGPLGASASTLGLPGMTTNTGMTTLDDTHPSYLEGDWQVRVTDVNGCTSMSPVIEVRISQTPIVTATNTGAYCAGESAVLIASAGILPLGQVDTLTFAWYDADPSVGGLTPIAFGASYTAGVLPEGQTTFWVTVSLNGCTSTPATTVVTVNETPVLENLSGGGSYCSGDLVTLSAEQLTATTTEMQYTWSGPNGFSFSGSALAGASLSADFTADLTTAGTYTLTATTAEGCAAEPQSILVEVRNTPATPTLTVNESVLCEGDDFVLTASQYTGTQSVTYVWTFDDGNAGPVVIATTTQPTYVVRNSIPANDGIYSVQVQLDGCPSFASNEVPVTVFSTLTALPTNNPTTAVNPACEGDIVRLDIQLIPGAVYEWFGPNNFRSQLPSPIVGPVTTADAGQYFATVTLNGCAAVVSLSTEVFVLEMPETPTIVNDGPVCEGGDITLSVSSNLAPTSITRMFEWYRASDNALLATTTDPNYTLAGVDRTSSGAYYVIMEMGNCRTPISVVTDVQVDYIPANLADAGEDQSLCAVQTIILDAEVPTIGTGAWTSLTGNTVSNPDLYNSEVIDLIQGDNIFVWTLSNGACMDYDSDTVVFTISTLPIDVAYAGEDVTICGPDNASISALRPTRASGEWTQTLAQASRGVTIAEPDSANTALSGLEVGSMYTFFWTLSDGVCEEFAQDTVIVTVSASPSERALVVVETYYSCGEDDLIIDAVVPQVGTGRWSTTSGATIANPNSPITRIERLDVGESEFIWTLSNGACVDYSSDTLIIVNDPMPEVSDDSYVADYETQLMDFEFTINDNSNSNEYTVTFDTLGLEGQVIGNLVDGFSFMPGRTFVGETSFSYTVCQMNCPDRCATANVEIRVMPGGECVAPSVITPNDDGYNDRFIVPCLADYPGSYLCVYNRWGDEVYQSQNYNNDWEGTFRDEPLPVGTYFYVLRVNDGSNEMIDGYVYIQR